MADTSSRLQLGHLTIWALIACFASTPMVEAAEVTPDGQHGGATALEAPPSPAEADEALSSTRKFVRSTVERVAAGLDSWFGDIPFTQGGSVTRGELGFSLHRRENEAANVGIRFKARFHLPNLASYQYLFVGNDDRRDIVTDQPESFTRQQQLLRNDQRDNAFFAGLGSTFRENFDARLGFRGGLKPYAQLRYKRPWQLSPKDKLEFRETLFYSVSERLGSTTTLSYERAVSPSVTARWLSALTATQADQNTTWSSNWGAYKTFGNARLLSLEALVHGVIGDQVGIADYGLQAKWAQPVYSKHLIGEVLVGHFWPRPDITRERDRAWAIGTSFTLKF